MDYLAVQMIDGRHVLINRQAIVTVTEPRKDAVPGKVSCVVTLSDGKFITVVESCDVIRQKLGTKP